MTTQTQLMVIAQKHYNSNPGVRALVLSITEAKQAASMNLEVVDLVTSTMKKALAGEPGYTVPEDNSQMMMNMFKASAALYRLANDYRNLAVVLQLIGEDVSY